MAKCTDRPDTAFGDDLLVADAGRILPATLATQPLLHYGLPGIGIWKGCGT